MQKKFIINLLFLLGANILIKPFWIFGIDRTVQNTVGAEQYGLYFAVFNFSLIFSFILDFGLTNYNNRNIAQHEHLINKYVSNILGIKCFLAFCYAFLTIIVAFCIGYDNLHFKLLLWVGINQILSSLILYLRSNITGLQKFKTDSIISILDRLLMILFCSVMIWGNVFHVEINIFYFAALQTLSYVITAIAAFFVVAKYSAFKKIHWNKNLSIVIFKQSLPFALLSFLMLFYYRVDSVMLERMLPDGSMRAGIYASAYRLLDAFNMIAYLFSVILLPLFSKMIAKKQNVGPIVKIATPLLVSSSLFLASCSFFFPTEIMNILYTDHIAESAAVLKIIMINVVFISLGYIFGTLLTANGNMKKLNIIAFIGVIVNLVLNLVLIPHYKELGATISGVITQFLMALFQIVFATKLTKFNDMKKTMTEIAAFAIIIFLTGFTLKYFELSIFYQLIIITAIWLSFVGIKIFTLMKQNLLKNMIISKQNKN